MQARYTRCAARTEFMAKVFTAGTQVYIAANRIMETIFSLFSQFCDPHQARYLKYRIFI